MKNLISIICSFAVLFFSSVSVFGQGTFATVQSILQAECSNSGCHGGGNANVFDVTVSKDDFYASIVNVPAVNESAAEKGNKIVDPGHPYNSFLLRKIGSNGFDPYIQMNDTEKNGHPSPLQKAEIELIRQWIIAGAQKDGEVVNYQLLQDYYTNGGTEFIPVPPAPPAGKGFQVRVGPIFLAPNEEVEYMKKEYLNNAEQLVVSGLNGHMTSRSHHLLLFKYENGQENQFRHGIRRVPSPEAFPFNSGLLTGAWQDDGDMDLPYGTAFKWQPNTTLDFDYHITNVGSSLILPADFYLNIYYYENPIEPIEMLAELLNRNVLVLNQGENIRAEEHIPGENRNIWLITSHTHKFGNDFDIYIRNSDGSKGEHIYEGFFDGEYKFNQGFYDWEHPAVRKFQFPLKNIKGNQGLIYETKWNVTSCTSDFPCNLVGCVCFGLTTKDEMMLLTYMYTKSDIPEAPTGIADMSGNWNFMVSPNPIQGETQIRFSVEGNSFVKLEVFDVLGKKVNTLSTQQLPAGNYSEDFPASQIGDNAGVYFITLTVDGHPVATQKVSKF